MNRKQTKTVLGFHSHRTRRRKTAALLLAASCFVTAGNASAFRIAGAAIPLETVSSQDAADNSSDAAYQLPGIRAPESAAPDWTDQEWIAALPDDTGLTLREKLARTAESQLGYQEHERSTEQAAGQKHGYTLYGEWYGDPCGDWNPMFVYYCLDHAGVPPERLLIGDSFRAWAARLEDAGLIRNAGNGTPVRGDILLLDTDSDGEADRTGIITTLQNDGSRLVVAAAEGDCDGTAAEQCYFCDAREILGFVSPEDPETCPALEYCSVSESGIIVYASADQDTFPAGTVMSVSDIAPEHALQIAAVSADDHQIILSAVAVDISFRDENGQELEPAEGQKVSIRLALPESGQLRGNTFSLLHQTDDGSVEKIPDAEITSDAVAFEADSFSIYIVSGEGEQEVVNAISGGNYNNSAENPYIMRYGETIRLKGRSSVDQRYLDPANKRIIAKTGDDNQWITNRWIDNYFVSEADFEAKSVGETTVVLQYGTDDEGNPLYEHFYIKVVNSDEDTIFVKTHFEPNGKGSDHIKENLYDPAHGITFVANVDGYVPNGPDRQNSISVPYALISGQKVELIPLMQDGVDENTLEIVEYPGRYIGAYTIGDQNTHDSEALKIHVGDTIRLIGRSNDGEQYIWTRDTNIIDREGSWLQNEYVYGEFQTVGDYVAKEPGLAHFVVQQHVNWNPNEKWYKDLYVLVLPSNPQNIVHEVSRDPQTGRLILEADEPGMIEIRNKLTGDSMFIEVSEDITLNHADMEIADGGTYKMVHEVYDENGNKTTTVEVYTASVSHINKATVYDKYGNELKSFSSDDGEYEQIGESGHGQFEFTSAYYGNEHPEKNFSAKETDHAQFDVSLTLVPNYAYTIDSEGNESAPVAMDNSESNWIEIPSVIFDLNEQDVIDALNKCPFTSGLDFTIRSDVTSVTNLFTIQPIAEKQLLNAELESGQFTFELEDCNDTRYAGKLVWNYNENQSKNDQEFALIPDTAKVSRAYQIVQRRNDTGEFIWGDHVDGDALGEALRSDPYYASIYNNSVNLLFDYLLSASNEEKQRFGEFAKPYFKDGVPVKDGDDYYGAKTVGYVMYTFDNFSFKPETGTLIEQKQNNSAGNVVFSPIILYNPGTYYYRIREIVPENPDNDIIYDAEPRILKVEIKKEEDVFVKTYTVLNEDLSEPAELTFINQYQQYILPATGGPGILPYLFVGTGFIALSFILLLSRRRKEVSDRP